MFGKKEITPAEMQELNRKSFKDTQKIFRKRLREIAAKGDNKAKYRPDNYCCGDRIADWLKSLGFTVKQNNPIWCEITWPEEEDILQKLRSESFKILTNPMPAKITWGVRIERQEGTWQKDMEQYDYICSACGKHAEYVSDYCPNCGKKMATLLDGNRY